MGPQTASNMHNLWINSAREGVPFPSTLSKAQARLTITWSKEAVQCPFGSQRRGDQESEVTADSIPTIALKTNSTYRCWFPKTNGTRICDPREKGTVTVATNHTLAMPSAAHSERKLDGMHT